MRFSRALLVVIFTGALVFFLGIGLPMLRAQDGKTIITLAAPEWMSDVFTDELFTDFEAQHPGVDVVLVFAGQDSFYGPAAFGIEDHLDGAEGLASTADIVHVSNYNLSVEATRAGYFLDLTPLLNTDTTVSEQDFVPGMLESFQWDQGTWALPIAGNLYLVIYNPAAFDEAGLPYPNESWTLDDYAIAMRALATTNADGEVTEPGFLDWSASGLLFRSLLGHGVYDETTMPAAPAFTTDAQLETLLTTWAELQQAGYSGSNFSGSSQDVPLRVDATWALGQGGVNNAEPMAAALLPGGAAGLYADAFAISRGTEHPQEAYELVKYLISDIEVVSRFFSDTPGLQSLVGVESEETPSFGRDFSPETQAVIDQARLNVIPVSDLRYMEYIQQALNNMSPEGENMDARTALEEVEALALENLQIADERRNTATVFVATPVPTPVLTAGEVSLRFGINSLITPLPGREQWDQAVQDFVASDPQVGQIIFDAGFSTPEQYNNDNYDCFYHFSNQVPTSNSQSIRNLDPYLDADPNFDESDVLPGVMSQLQRDNMTWAYPLIIQPSVLWYSASQFDEAGIPYPDGGWEVDEFRDAIQRLRGAPDGDASFSPESFGNTYLLLLIAAHGGLPLDYRTDPPTINYTDLATVDAIRQVLDLAKEGYIDYNELGDFSGGGGLGNQPALTDDMLNVMSWRFRNAVGLEDLSLDPETAYQLTLFPRGSQYTAAAMDIGAGYITANSLNPDACYRWLTFIEGRPELFSAMPARRSMVQNLTSTATQSLDVTEIFNQIDTMLQDPNLIVFPTQFSVGAGSFSNFIIPIWLNRVFDAYVLEDADLEAELAEAATFTDAYIGCAADLVVYDANAISQMTQDEQTDYFRQYADCAVSVDPSLASMFVFADDE